MSSISDNDPRFSTDQRAELERYDRIRARLATDPYRPAYHFSPPGGIVHDPNGAVYWNGRYHLFYQFRPPGFPEEKPWHEAMHWGHAVSDDLLHWEDRPIALSPADGPEGSCYSGQAIAEDDRVVLMYYGTGTGNSIATSDESGLVNFEKSPENPVIPHDEAAPYTVFDPDIWTDGEYYYSVSGTHVGERHVDSKPAVYLFRSDDLVDWEYLHPFLREDAWTVPGEDAAVPNFLDFGDAHALLCFSHERGAHHYIGEYDEETNQFTPHHHGRLTHGPTTHRGSIGELEIGNLHAPSVLKAPDGRQIVFYNVNTGKGFDEWAEVISLPRVIGLTDDRTGLTVEPIEEVKTLRTDHRSFVSRSIRDGDETVLDRSVGRVFEVDATIDLADAGAVRLSVLRSPDTEESTHVTYYPRTDTLELDTTESTTRTDVPVRPPEQARLALADDEPLRLRVFVDRSIVEVFANGRQCLTARVYPDREDSTGLSVSASRGDAKLRSMDCWRMTPVWEHIRAEGE